jgi:N-acetylglucosamine-6-sulfatase
LSGKTHNVILILSDDHRYDFMGFMGKPKFLQTLHLDRMAREGCHLQNAFVSTALCSPSRASILTGQYAHRHGVVDNNAPIPQSTVFFPHYLQQRGYQTAFMGKWHMGDQTDHPRPGFHKWISFRGQGEYYDPLLNIDGQAKQCKGYVTDLLTDYALEWLKQVKEQPFFLFLSHKAVHSMFEPAKRHLDCYKNAAVEYPQSMKASIENDRGKPHWVVAQRASYHGADYLYEGEMDFDTFYRRYCETLLSLDESVGRVLDFVRQSGLEKNTLVLYMGDNGFCFGEHGLIDKRHMYEESMRVPMLAWGPCLAAPGMRVPNMVQNIDVGPTILEACGLQAPAKTDGRSFLPLLKGEKIPWRDEIFYEYYWEHAFPQTPTTLGIRTNRFKFIRYHGLWDTDELYDLQNDPAEKNNLIDAPDFQTAVTDLKERMFTWLEQTDGMQIPLRRDAWYRFDKHKPQ